MKDGFDKSVAEKMPRIQKSKPNRPWNVDPVQLRREQEMTSAPAEQIQPETPAPVVLEPQLLNTDSGVAQAVLTIEELNQDFATLICEKKDIHLELRRNQQLLEETRRDKVLLQQDLSELKRQAGYDQGFANEISFLNEQLQDSEYYIHTITLMLDDKTRELEGENRQRRELENKLLRMNASVQDKAKLDVKVSLLQRDLKIAHSRLTDLEEQLECEYQKREPLEKQIVELKKALDSVYASLSHVRLKAKREAYGS